MALVATTVPTLRKAPWGYQGFLGGAAHATVTADETSATYYLENTSSLPIVVALDASARGTYKIELYDNCTFTGSTPVDSINSNRKYSLNAINSPLRIFTEASSVSLGTAIWTWHGISTTPVKIFGEGSITGAYLVLAGNTKSALTVEPASGGDVDISPTDSDMELANTTYWPVVSGYPFTVPSKLIPSAPSPNGGNRALQLKITSLTWGRVKPLTVPTFDLDKTYTISLWMRGSKHSGEVYYSRADAYILLPDGNSEYVNGALNIKDSEPGWRYVSETITPASGYETRLWLGFYLNTGPVVPEIYCQFDQLSVTEHNIVPVTLNFSYTLWDGSLFGDV